MMKQTLILLAAMVAMAFVASAQSVTDSVVFKGFVVDSINNESIPMIKVDVWDKHQTNYWRMTDFDGAFTIPLRIGEYDIEVSWYGYKPYRNHIEVTNSDLYTIKIQPLDIDDLVPIVIECPYYPPIEIGPDGAMQKMEIDGVTVRVR
jgi:hypothetical protein